MRSPFRPSVLPDPAILDNHRPLIRSLQRRGLFRGGVSLGALTLLTGCDISNDSAIDHALRAVSAFNDRVQAALFDPNKLAPEYPASMVLKPPRFNAYFPNRRPPAGERRHVAARARRADRQQAALDPPAARRLAGTRDDHPPRLRRGLGLYRPMVRRAAPQLPRARWRRPEGQIRRLQDRRRLPEQHRHGDRAAPADPARHQIRRRDHRPTRTAIRSACACRPSSATKTRNGSPRSRSPTPTRAATGKTSVSTGLAGI